MPAAAKSSTSAAKKTTGAPKAKGAVRAKSGCYTCRIRRKKCDEQPNEEGHCQTCVRLRLECLGFGAKRPDWLRESRNVVELREKIKAFLAEQGMIKGHSGTAPRNAVVEEEPSSTLRLADETYNSATDSPPTPTLALSAADSHRAHQGLNTSSIRDDAHWPTLATPMPNMEHYNQHHGLHPSQLRTSPSPYPTGFSQGEMVPPTYSLPPTHPLSSSNPSASSNDTVAADPAWNSNSSLLPITPSAFSPLYTAQIFLEAEPQFEPLERFYVQPNLSLPNGNTMDELFTRYCEQVIGTQYMLVQEDTRALIIHCMKQYALAAESARLLVYVHWHKFKKLNHNALDDPGISVRFHTLCSQLVQHPDDVGKSMSALLVISSFLFDGGTGDWKAFLDIACRYSMSILRNYAGPKDALMRCSKDIAFIIKTSFWFDVLSSITLGRTPYFLQIFREVFAPQEAFAHSSAFINDDDMYDVPDQISMMNVMGCENTVVWAMAEITELARWKKEQAFNGRLSIPELVHRGQGIERYLPTPNISSDDQPSTGVYNYRDFTSNIFRASTHLYLQSVISGDFPGVQQISDCVSVTLACISQIPDNRPTGKSSIIRSSVFSVFICGCLTDKKEQRQKIIEQLDRHFDGVGNTGSVKRLLESVWSCRNHANQPVPWREMLLHSNVLLV